MNVALVQFTPWDKAYYFDPGALKVASGDFVVVETQLGVDLGEVIGFEEIADGGEGEKEIKKVERVADKDDLAKKLDQDSGKEEALELCKHHIDRANLPMKLVDVHFSFDDKRVVFAFIAQGRVDFRDLAKDLTHFYKKNVRLQQLGIRDEMKLRGDVGPCGRGLCCQKFVKELGSITSDLAETQQVAHRGSDRLSGNCGRLRCCLAFEKNNYQELVKNLPALGSKVKTAKGEGTVVGWHTLKQTVDVRVYDNKEKAESYLEIPIVELK